MSFQNFGPSSSRSQPPSSITFCNTGSGVGVVRGVNGPIVEMNTLSGHHIQIGMLSDDRTISIDASELHEYIAKVDKRVLEMSTILSRVDGDLSRIPGKLSQLSHDAVDGDSKLRSRLGQLEARPGFQLPESLYDLAQMPKFHGSVPVIQNGKWAAINLSNDFFSKYESKMDACIAVTGDVRRKFANETAASKAHMDTQVAKLEEKMTRWMAATFILGIMIIVLTLKVAQL